MEEAGHTRRTRPANRDRQGLRRRLSHRLRPGEDEGTAVIEFALVLPILAVLVMGIIDFGSMFSTWSTLRQGTWAGARAASVGNFSAGGCTLTFSGGGLVPSADIQSLMCLTKTQIGLNQSSTRIAIILSDPTLTSTGAQWMVGSGVTICAEIPATSQTGFFAPAFSGRYLRTKTTVRIEQASANVETQGYEVDPSGGGWSWCTPQSPAP